MQTNPFVFYEMMWYPLPRGAEQFSRLQSSLFTPYQSDSLLSPPVELLPSRSTPSPLLDEYVAHIDRRWRLYKSLPFVEHIYLCNSLTFNHLDEESDIDLFIIASPNRLWIARLWSRWLFSLLGLKRWGNLTRKKFCLSFYVTTDHLNLYDISLQPYDIYLTYRIAHLVPLYSQTTTSTGDIRSSNRRITWFLPNIPLGPNICIGTKHFSGATRCKWWIELLHGGRRWTMINTLIKLIWSPIIYRKTRRLWSKWRGITISDTMLKFHADQRKKYNILYRMFS